MIKRFSAAVRVISIGLLFIVFMFSYANMPNRVLIGTDAAGNPSNYIDKDVGFYVALSVFILTNFLFYQLLIYCKRLEPALANVVYGWTSALIILINFFFAFAAAFIGILNSRENFDYSNFGYLIFVIATLFGIWFLGFLINLIRLKIKN